MELPDTLSEQSSLKSCLSITNDSKNNEVGSLVSKVRHAGNASNFTSGLVTHFQNKANMNKTSHRNQISNT